MTRHFVIVLVALTAFVYLNIECSAQSLDLDTHRSYEHDMSDVNSIERMGMAEASASVNQYRPGLSSVRLVSCYSCVDCPIALANTTTKYCPYTNDPTKNNKCIVYTEKYIQLKKLWYVRGCASERGSCADIKRGHDNSPTVTLSSCSECEGDQCNTSGVSLATLDIPTAIFVLVVCPIFGKYTLS